MSNERINPPKPPVLPIEPASPEWCELFALYVQSLEMQRILLCNARSKHSSRTVSVRLAEAQHQMCRQWLWSHIKNTPHLPRTHE